MYKLVARFLCRMINVRDEELCVAFGRRLQSLRLYHSLSQEKLANIADISISQISRLERGLLNPTLSTIYALATALEVDVSMLVSGLLTTGEEDLA